MPLIAGIRMESVGGFTLESPIEVGVRESDWTAIDGSGEPCVLELSERFDDGSAAGDHLGAFIERAAIQRRVASAGHSAARGLGGGHVVPIRAIEATDFGAYFVRDRYGLSASELIAGKVRLRADALHEIVSGVLGGLLVFRERGGRPHGGLDAGCVLISDGAPGTRRMGLRSPATAGELAAISDPDADELRRLGMLIFALVLHRPFRAMGGYPVRDGTEWQALGGAGPFWLGLVNELLDPSGCRATLGDIASRVASLRFKVDGPGPVVWLTRVGVAATAVAVIGGGLWLGLKPGVAPPRADYRDEEFELWLRVTPMVASMREQIARMENPPAVLTEAIGRLEVDQDARIGVSDVFDVQRVFEQVELAQVFQARLDGHFPGLIQGVQSFAQADLESRAVTQKESADQRRLEELAGLYRAGLERFGIDASASQETSADAGVAVGSDNDSAPADSSNPALPGLLDAFRAEQWQARGAIADLTGGEDAGWLHPSAAALFESQLAELRDGLDLLEAGAADGMGFEQATARQPASDAVSASVAGFLDSVRSVERAAGVVGVWRDALYPRIESGSSAITAGAAWPSVPGEIASRLPAGGDPFLNSFASFASAVGAVGPGENDEDLGRRLQAAADAVDAVRGVVENGWNAGSVDLIAHARWVESVRSRLEATPTGADGGVLASWIDARIELSDEWLGRVEQAATVPASGDWPAADFGVALDAAQAKWREAIDERAEETREVEAEIAGGVGVVKPAIEAIRTELAEIRALPRWQSLRDEVGAASGELEAEFLSLSSIIDRIHAEVLQDPRELIQLWRDDPVAIDGFSGSAVLSEKAEAIGEVYAREWEAWARERGLEDDALKREPESDRLQVALRGVGEIVALAGDEIRRVLNEDRSYGSFDRDLIREACGVWLTGRFVDALDGFEGWHEKPRVAAGGAFDSKLRALSEEAGEVLDAFASDLSLLSDSTGLVARGYAIGDGTADSEVGDRAALAARLDRLRSSEQPKVAGLEGVARAFGVVDGLLGIGRIDDPADLVDAFVAESGTAGRAGVGVEAIRRLDEIGRAGEVWPASVDAMLRERERLADGVASLRRALAERDWGERSGEMQTIVRAWWLRGVGGAENRAAFTRGVTGASDWFDLGDDAWDGLLGAHILEGRSRFNARVIELRTEIDELAGQAMVDASRATTAEIPKIDQRLIGEIRGLLGEIRQLARETLGDGARSGALSWVAAFEQQLEEAQGGRRGWDERGVGPVGLGLNDWSVVLNEDAEPPRVVYSYNPKRADEAVSIEFRLIPDLESGGQVFLSVDEVSVAVCAAMLKAVGGAIDGNLITDWYDKPAETIAGNSVFGPTARNLFTRGPANSPSRFRLRARPAWLEGVVYGPKDSAAYPAYPDDMVGAAPNTISGSQGGQPDGAHPVNYIKGSVANELAIAFGFRLPTVEEFEAGLRLVPGTRSGRWNLRDATFPRQAAHVRAAQALKNVSQYEPGLWSYDATAGANDAFWELETRDDRLWFYRTGAGVENGFQDGILFRHLIGNVAEYVLVDESASRGRGIRIMGASALSDPAVQPGDAREASGSHATPSGFVDVGFRLAIDADDFGSLGKLVRRQLADSADASFVAGGR